MNRLQELAGIHELAPLGTPSPVVPTSPKLTSDVQNLTKLVSSNTSLLNKLKTINNGQEVTEFLSFILSNINDKVSGVQKQKIKSLIDQRFK